MNEARVLRLVDAQARARGRAESRLLNVVLLLLGGMVGRWYDDRAVKQFGTEVSRSVAEAQAAVGGLTSEFLDAVMVELGAVPPRARSALPTQLRKVDPLVEWQRPAEQYRYAKSRGATDAEAQQAARLRTEVLLDDDVSLAQRIATVTRLKDYPDVTGYRRVIHPELSKSGTCGLCAVASDRIYKLDRLMPVHGRCNCGVLPITAEWDPGSSLNKADLVKLYDEAGSTAAEDLKRTRFTVEDHSELGPQFAAAA